LSGRCRGWRSPSGSPRRRNWRRCGIGMCGAAPGRKPGSATVWTMRRSWTKPWALTCWIRAFWRVTGTANCCGRRNSLTSMWRAASTPPPEQRCGGTMIPGPANSPSTPVWPGWTRAGTFCGKSSWSMALSGNISPPWWTTGTAPGRCSAGGTSGTSA